MRKLSIKKALVALAAVGIVFLPSATALSEWGPDRPTFTLANPATYVTFNSITDNHQAVGDERHFYTANHTGTADYSHSLNVSDNQEVTLRTYFHNDAAANLNLVAFNTRVKMLLPNSESADQASVSYISADNANPTAVWDTVHLTSDKAFTLEYEKGSAKLFNNVFTGGTSLSDNIVTDSGAQVGFDKVDGKVPGCLNFSGYVTIKVKIHVKEKPAPAYKCDLLDITAKDRKVTISKFETTAVNGAVYKNADINWGDGSANQNFVSPVGQSHEYNKDGTYTISATAHFTVNGQDVTSNGPECQKQVTFKSGQPPEVTPPTETPGKGPTELVNTGPGEVAGIFGAVTAAGAVAHRWMLGRRLGRQ